MRRRDGRSGVEVFDKGRREALRNDAVVWQELEGVGVRRALGLDEDGSDAAADAGEPWGGRRSGAELYPRAGRGCSGRKLGSDCAKRASPSRRCPGGRLRGGPGEGSQCP